MNTKDQIIAAIRREARQRGGRVSIRAFVAATGIDQQEIIGKHWARWNDALAEAGLETTSFEALRQPTMDDDLVVEAIAHLAQRLGRWPSRAAFSHEHHRNPSFPGVGVVQRVTTAVEFWPKLTALCAGRSEFDRVAQIASSRLADDEANTRPTSRQSITGYVYLMRSGRRHKIGRTNSPSRRHREVRVDLPDPTNLVHSIPTDDPAGIEAYWHKRFESKRVRDTEFFDLDSSDVAAFRRRKYQ
jgi:hypothetical protein